MGKVDGVFLTETREAITPLDAETLRGAFEILEARWVIEPQLYASAVLKMRSAEIARLSSMSPKSRETPAAWARLDREFRAEFASLFGNQILVRCSNLLIARERALGIDQVWQKVWAADASEPHCYHKPLVSALSNRNAPKATALIREHLTQLEPVSYTHLTLPTIYSV